MEIRTSSNKAFIGNRPAAQFARGLMNAPAINAVYADALTALQSDDFAAFLAAMKRFEALEQYILGAKQ